MPDRSSIGPDAAPPGPSRPSSVPDPHSDDLDELHDLDDPVTEEDLDPLAEWPDDEPLPDDFDEDPVTDEPDPLASEPADDDGELPESFDEDPVEPEPVDAFEPVVLPWRTRARLPEHDLLLDAVLDPTRERSRWFGGVPGPLRIVVGGVDVVVEPEVAEGAPLLRVGRDVLSGRILVES